MARLPSEFTSRRDALAAEARRAGDRALAAEVKKLRRPTTGAWLANLLVRQRRDEVAQLLDSRVRPAPGAGHLGHRRPAPAVTRTPSSTYEA